MVVEEVVGVVEVVVEVVGVEVVEEVEVVVGAITLTVQDFEPVA